jgi:hypothetical protein
MLSIFAMVSSVFYVFLQVFHTHVSSVLYSCLKCSICLQTNIASVASECFKTRPGVAYVVMCVRAVSPLGWGTRAPYGHGKPRHRQGRAVFFFLVLCEHGCGMLVWET